MLPCMNDRTPDRMPTGDTDSQQASDGPPTGHVTVSVGEAAQRLGVTPDAIRARLHRGTLEGEKVEGVWRVRLPESDRQDGAVGATGDQQDAPGQPTGNDGDRQDADSPATGHATADLAPLAAVIKRLSRQVDERDQRIQEQHERIETLSSSESMWRTHALHLQNRVAELEELASIEAGQANVDAAVESPEQDDDADTDTQPPSGDHESLRTPVEDIPSQVTSTKVERRARVDLIAGDITVPSIEDRKSAQKWWARWMRRLVRRSDLDS